MSLLSIIWTVDCYQNIYKDRWTCSAIWGVAKITLAIAFFLLNWHLHGITAFHIFKAFDFGRTAEFVNLDIPITSPCKDFHGDWCQVLLESRDLPLSVLTCYQFNASSWWCRAGFNTLLELISSLHIAPQAWRYRKIDFPYHNTTMNMSYTPFYL